MTKKHLIYLLMAGVAGGAVADEATVESLSKKLEVQQAQIDALAEALEAEKEGVAHGGRWFENTTLGGYAEHHFNHFENKDDEIDAHRWVLYISHEFTDTVRMFSEFELEHGLAGEGKDGEVELEQAFIEWQFNPSHRLSMGQFLVPVGILNETHEPDTFYGVERNNVEKNIVPSTWWETGVMLSGEVAQGLSYDFAVHSGLEVDPTEFNIRSGRQKSAKATAEDLAYTGRLAYRGIRGLELATTVQYQQDVSQGGVSDADATLIEAHAAYQVGGFGLRALYAVWDIDGDEVEALGKDEQEGYFVEPSYRITENLGVFARYSEWDNEAGDSTTESKIEQVHAGVNYWLTDHVVLKADILEEDKEAGGDDSDGYNVGIGWSF